MFTRGEFLKRVAVGALALPFLSSFVRSRRRRVRAKLARRRRRLFAQECWQAGMLESEAGQPNVLFILTDDQPYHTLYRMGAGVGSLLGSGTDFTSKGYVIVPLCGPARVSLFTGYAPHNHGATTNTNAYEHYRSGGWAQRDVMARMKGLGYRTGYFGKLINGYGQHGDTGKWVHPYVDRWVTLVGGQGQDPYTINSDGNLREETQNHTPFFGQKAEAFIRMNADCGPWFCWLNWTDPHGPFTPPPLYEHTYDAERYESPGVDETDLSDKSRWMKEGLKYAGPQTQQDNYEGIMEELGNVDVWVEKLRVALEETGQLENTIVIFTTDNGFMVGEHGDLTKKSAPYEESSRIPFVVRGPGFAQGVVSDAFTSHLDIPATIIHAGGGDPSDLDGRSLLASAGGAIERKRELIEMPDLGWYMVREENYVYIEFASGEVEMYDLSVDPYEVESFRDASLEASFSASLAALKEGRAESLRAAETA